MANKQLVELSIWSDKWFYNLKIEEKLLFLYLLTNPEITPSGIFQIIPKIVDFYIGINNTEKIIKNLSEKVIYDEEHGLIWIKNYFIKNSQGPKILKSVENTLEKYKNSFIYDDFIKYYKHFNFNLSKKAKPNSNEIPKLLRDKIIKRDGKKCQYCGKKLTDEKIQLDHVYPRVLGGKNSENNLLVSCGACNNKKGTMLIEDFLQTIEIIENRDRVSKFLIQYRDDAKPSNEHEHEHDNEHEHEEIKKVKKDSIIFDVESFKYKPIPDSFYQTWKKAFPDVLIDIEISKAESWLKANPKKNKKNHAAFLNNWFSRAQQQKDGIKKEENFSKAEFSVKDLI